MRRHGLTDVASLDLDLDRVPGLRRILPGHGLAE
jgi:hypothetical protein